MRDIVYVAGHGKLAAKIQGNLVETSLWLKKPVTFVDNWDNVQGRRDDRSQVVLVHCGSGRQFNDIVSFGNTNNVPVIQCSTGITFPEDFAANLAIPFIEAPNLSIPMIKFLYLIEEIGPLFHDSGITITESHQKSKVTLAGTALEMAKLLGIEQSKIKSIRDEDTQENLLGISKEHLGQHALHLIEISDGECVITLKTEVHGLNTYVEGLVKIISIIGKLPPGFTRLTDLVRRRLI